MTKYYLNSAIIACYLLDTASKEEEEKDKTSILKKNHPPSRWRASIEA